MSGGSREYMASYLKDVQKTTETGGYNYNFVNNFNNLSQKYVTGYLGTATLIKRRNNYQLNAKMYGDAVWETSNDGDGQSCWNANCSEFPYLVQPFLGRGGGFSATEGTGIFYFSGQTGYKYNGDGFRAVAIVSVKLM